MIEKLQNPEPKTQPKYNVEPEEFRLLQEDLIKKINDLSDDVGIHAVWLNTDNKFSNLVRTLEAGVFPEITAFVTPLVESRSRFLTILDTSDDHRRILHGFRISSISISNAVEEEHKENRFYVQDDNIGLAMVDELIQSGQGFTAKEFIDYYERIGVDIKNCISVETNFRVGEKVETDGLRVSDLGYIAIFNSLERKSTSLDDVCVFAYLNAPAIKSLQATGIEYRPFAGREDLKAPGVDDDFDEHYIPIAIPKNKRNTDVFKSIAPFGAPEVEL